MSPLDVWAGPIFAALIVVAFVPGIIADRRRRIKARKNARRAAWERRQAERVAGR